MSPADGPATVGANGAAKPVNPLDDARRTLDQSDALLERRKGDRRQEDEPVRCRKCDGLTKVYDKRGTVRWRECRICHVRFTTEEVFRCMVRRWKRNTPDIVVSGTDPT